MKQQLLAVTKTTITGVRENKESWLLETMAAIKFEFRRDWKITPQLNMPVQLFFGKGGRLLFIHIPSSRHSGLRGRMISINTEEEEKSMQEA